MYKYKAEPLSNEDICELTKQLRGILKCSSTASLNIVAILEHAMPQLYENFIFSVREKKDMRIDSHAYTDPDNNEIVIREDIYDRARNGEGRDRFTIAHEIGHFILHNTKLLTLTRTYPNEKIKPYEDVEWQADSFAGELLCPACALKKMSVEEAADYYGVSLSSARVQKRKSQRCLQL